MPLYIVTRCVASCVLLSNPQKLLIIASGCIPSPAVLGSHQFGLPIGLGAQGGSQIKGGREQCAGGSAGLLTLSEGLEIELTHFEEENVKLKVDYLRQVVEIVIRGVPTIVEICFMCLFMPSGRILLQGSVSTNLFNQVRHSVDRRKLEFGI